MNDKEIEKCPICGTGVEQDVKRVAGHIGVKVGSHCPECGVKFSFNKKDKDA